MRGIQLTVILCDMETVTPVISRHKTAIRRTDLSRPVKSALNDGLIAPSATVFDYGCGHGQDIEFLLAQGIACDGWDPVFRPDASKHPADVVNLGYVMNVIEDVNERASTLRQAWNLAQGLLIVAALVNEDDRGQAQLPFGDGVLTGRGTFQKFFRQGELKTFLEGELQTEAIPASLGIFYVFKNETLQQQFLANRFRRRAAAPRKRISELRFEEHRELLESLMAAIADFGRLPEEDEFLRSAEVVAAFGSLKRGFELVRRVTGSGEWEAIRQRRTEDLLVYLALARFRRRPLLGQLPRTLQRDIRSFFGTYTKACQRADELLFRTGDAVAIDEACRRSAAGKKLPDDLYVHRSALDSLEPLLRIYEGCGRAYLGDVEGANIIKIHRRSGKLSYLIYPDFEGDPHPALLRSVRVNLRSRQIDCNEYAQSANRPILHRKDSFLGPGHPLREKFARLTAQEEKYGLLDDASGIGTRDGWTRRLAERGFALKGHRLVRSSGQQNDPAQLEG
ncbi:MAG TPA: DNA phosphorothioation-associated putative methyltransferase [Gemmataceae bacterium]|nr:DNA phosphorothioation-associated putative methyltransferase [Gemmataceae bacterium]